MSASIRRFQPVHPRSRGEHGTQYDLTTDPDGSSPLARGTPRTSLAASACRRFIPARAGNTTWTRRSPRSTTVHPRSRGEHAQARHDPHDGRGSSPLARGTRRAPPGRKGRVRFIPARAGNTGRMLRAPPPRSVHPRSRGEHPRRRHQPLRLAGSSPLARGTRRAVPASNRCGPVHPRSRGEHTSLLGILNALYGSSPLARGTLRHVPVGRADRRFIPARAGNTGRQRPAPDAAPVHPRSRGEHSERLC